MAKELNSEILVTNNTIRKEKQKLTKIFEPILKEIGESGKKTFTDKGILLDSLIGEAAFVRAVLLEGQRLIKQDGIETTTVNGSQKYKNATPATKIYAEYLRTYSQLVTTLIAHIPERKEQKQTRLQAMILDR